MMQFTALALILAQCSLGRFTIRTRRDFPVLPVVEPWPVVADRPVLAGRTAASISAPVRRFNMGISSVPADALATNPCDHILVLCRAPGVSWTVKNTIFVEGEIRRIS